MAKETTPIEVPHDWGIPYDRVKADKQYDATLKAAADTARAKHPGDMVGETISWQIADGYATYMVVKQKPLMVAHVNSGDGYQVDPIMIRGLRVSDVRERVARDKAFYKAVEERKK
jgi:hypothetical protein